MSGCLQASPAAYAVHTAHSIDHHRSTGSHFRYGIITCTHLHRRLRPPARMWCASVVALLQGTEKISITAVFTREDNPVPTCQSKQRLLIGFNDTKPVTLEFAPRMVRCVQRCCRARATGIGPASMLHWRSVLAHGSVGVAVGDKFNPQPNQV